MSDDDKQIQNREQYEIEMMNLGFQAARDERILQNLRMKKLDLEIKREELMLKNERKRIKLMEEQAESHLKTEEMIRAYFAQCAKNGIAPKV